MSTPSIEPSAFEDKAARRRVLLAVGLVVLIAGASVLGVSCHRADTDDRRAGDPGADAAVVAPTPAPTTPVNVRGLVLLLLRTIVNGDIATAEELICWLDESPDDRSKKLTRLLNNQSFPLSADDVLTIRRKFDLIVLDTKQDGDRIALTMMWPWFGWSRANTRTFVFRLDGSMLYGGGLLSWDGRFSPHAPTFASPR